MLKQRHKKKKLLSEFLPSTPCTPEMRQKVIEVAELRGQTLAEVQREAMTLFLDRNYSKTIVNDSPAIAAGELEAVS